MKRTTLFFITDPLTIIVDGVGI